MQPIMTREQAYELGLKKFDYLPCKQCGRLPRYTVSGNCVYCSGQYAKKWREANPERNAELKRNWTVNNWDYLKQYKKANKARKNSALT